MAAKGPWELYQQEEKGPWTQFQGAAPSEPPAKSTERTWGEAAKDVAASAIGGLGSLAQFPGQLVKLVPGLQGVGEALETPGEYIAKAGEALKSEGLKAREALRSKALSEAEKDGVLAQFATAITSTIKDPALITSFVAEQVPLLIGPMGAAKVTQMIGRKGLEKATAGLTGEAAEAAALEAVKRLNTQATRAAIGTGAAMQGADVSSDTYQNAYQAALRQGMTEEQANDAALNAARIAAVGAGAVSLGTTGLLSKFGGAAIEKRLAGLPGQGRIPSAFGEATSESLEEAGGQLAQNIAVRQIDPTQSLTSGVGTAAGLGALGGGLFGGLLGKKPQAELLPGQKEGEDLYTAAARINREIQYLDQMSQSTEQDQGRKNAGVLTNGELVDMYRDQGYGAVKQYQLQLAQQFRAPDISKEQRIAIGDALKNVTNMLSVVTAEEYSRKAPSNVTNVLTDSDVAVKLGIARDDPVYKELVNKDIGKPADAQAVIASLENALNRKGLRQTQRERFATALTNVNEFLATVPGSGFYAATPVQQPSGERVGVAGVAGERPAAARPQESQPTGVVRPTEVVGEPVGGAGVQPPTVEAKREEVAQPPAAPPPEVAVPAPPAPAVEAPAAAPAAETVAAPVAPVAVPKYKIVATEVATDTGANKRAWNVMAGDAIVDTFNTRKEAQTWVNQSKTAKPSLRPETPPAGVPANIWQMHSQLNTLEQQLGGELPMPTRTDGRPQTAGTLGGIQKRLFRRYNAAVKSLVGDAQALPFMRRLNTISSIQRVVRENDDRALETYKVSSPQEYAEVVEKKRSVRPETEARAAEILKKREAEPQAAPEAELSQADAYKASRALLVKQLDGILKKILAKYGLKDVTLNLRDAMEDQGSYARQVIELALNVENPVRTLRHESIHALKDMGFFTDAQWKVLEKRAKDEWIGVLQKTKHDATQSRYDAYVKLFTQEGTAKGLTGDALTKYVEEAVIEEAIADAFGDFDAKKAPPGMMNAILNRMRNLFKAIKEAFGQAGIESAEDIFGKIEEGKLKPTKEVAPKVETEPEAVKAVPSVRPQESNAWQASDSERQEALDMYNEDGFLPYVSQGFLNVPLDGKKYSLQKYNPEKHLAFDPVLNVPINKDGTITAYYHTTKAGALNINNNKMIAAEGRNRIYLTNESGGADVLRNRGSFDQELDGSTVLVYVTPDMLQVDQMYDNGRVDFFIPLAQGEYFNKKMKMQSIQKARTEAIAQEFSYDDHEEKITKAVEKYKASPASVQKAMVKRAKEILKREHNVASLLTENGKLEKTRIGEYDLSYDGLPVASQGLGLASAQKITEKTSTCPRSSICEGLCLGETSGGNFMFGGAAAEDVGDIQKSAFRAGARMMQYLKTEALIVHPQEFAVLLQSEIDALKRWSEKPTQRKKNPETGKVETIAKEIYAPAVRLNVTSDFKPEMFRGVIEGNPDVMFYDYTKINSNSIADNHHLTYSSTGFGQIVDGERVFFKNKAGNYDHNWGTVRQRLNDGYNVAMAFSSKSGLPKTLTDEETGIVYKVLDGDLYDARFLDEYSPEKRESEGRGVIVGLRNKAGTLSEKNATQKTGGFFVNYDPKRDGSNVTVPDQAQFKPRRIPITAKPSLRTSPDTPQFKFWFGKSTIVDKDGNPKVMYHGTGKDYEILGTGRRQANAIFLTDDPEFAEKFAKDTFMRAASEAAKGVGISEDAFKQGIKRAVEAIRKDYKASAYGKDLIAEVRKGYDSASPEAQEYMTNAFRDAVPAGPNIIPVYVKAEYPFDYENDKHLEAIEPYFKELTNGSLPRGGIQNGVWSIIENADVQKAIRQAGFDSFYVKEHGQKSLAVYNPNQVKSVFNQAPTEAPELRRSLRSIASAMTPQVATAVNKIAPPTYTPNLAERILSAINGDSFTKVRAAAVNRYEKLAEMDRRVAKEIERMGGVQQLADSKAETAALFSDLGAGLLETAMGAHDRVGGVPVFRNGVTTISNLGGTVKGPIAIFKPLADLKDPNAYRLYQTWAAVKRGKRLNDEGRGDPIDATDIATIEAMEQNNPNIAALFNAIQQDWIKYNDGLVKYMQDTGVITSQMAAEWTKHGDYFPFYRLIDEDVAGPKMFTSIGNVRQPQKLKGSEAPLGDFFENIIRNSQAAIQAGIKNVAAQRATEQALRLNEVTRLPRKEPNASVYRVLENGREVFYQAHDPLFIEAIKGLNMPDLPFIGLLAGPANLLRNLVTKDPAFMLANMMRDSLSAWATSGVKMTPMIDTFKNFGKAIAGQSPELQQLYAAGVLGGYDYARGAKVSAEEFQKRLREVSGTKTKFEKITSPATSLWGALEKGTQASDAATRMEVYKRVLAETGNEAEAYWQALEVMNFNRKGNSAVVRILTAAIPFLNARMQGLDLLFRTAIMPVGKTASEQAKSRMKTFWVRGMTIMSLSAMYWLLTHDDDEYKKQEQETRDNFWLIPSLGVKIPIPFEVGVMFKVIPERIMALTFGQDTNKDFTDAMKRQFLSTFGMNFIPQVALPIYEVRTNYSFFTDRPIIGKGLEGVAPQFQVGPGTSRVAELLGKSVGLSPMKVDYLIKGYTGTMGQYASDLFDMVFDMTAENPKASKRFEQMPIIRRFAVDPEARGTVTSYYKVKDSVDEIVRSANLLERSMNLEEWGPYYSENIKMLAVKDYLNDLEKTMKDYREMRQFILSSSMSADAKRDSIKSIGQMEIALTKNIQTLKKQIQ